MLAWPDGARQLIGHDGMVVNVEPTLYRSASAAVQELDARVPRELRVDLPARDAGEIPRPQRVPWRARWRSGERRVARHARGYLCG